jgi:chromosome segregation ATPase
MSRQLELLNDLAFENRGWFITQEIREAIEFVVIRHGMMEGRLDEAAEEYATLGMQHDKVVHELHKVKTDLALALQEKATLTHRLEQASKEIEYWFKRADNALTLAESDEQNRQRIKELEAQHRKRSSIMEELQREYECLKADNQFYASVLSNVMDALGPYAGGDQLEIQPHAESCQEEEELPF